MGLWIGWDVMAETAEKAAAGTVSAVVVGRLLLPFVWKRARTDFQQSLFARREYRLERKYRANRKET